MKKFSLLVALLCLLGYLPTASAHCNPKKNEVTVTLDANGKLVFADGAASSPCQLKNVGTESKLTFHFDPRLGCNKDCLLMLRYPDENSYQGKDDGINPDNKARTCTPNKCFIHLNKLANFCRRTSPPGGCEVLYDISIKGKWIDPIIVVKPRPTETETQVASQENAVSESEPNPDAAPETPSE